MQLPVSSEMNTYSYEDIHIGDFVQFDVRLTDGLLQSFAQLSGDYNPLHLDDGYALTSVFKKRVVYGMLLGSLFSRLVGMHLPGKYCLYLSQILSFKKTVFIDDAVTVRGEIISKKNHVLTIKTQILKGSVVAVEGEARVMCLRVKHG